MLCTVHALLMRDTLQAMLFTSSAFALSQHAVSHPVKQGVPFWPITLKFSAQGKRSADVTNTIVQRH